MRRRAYSVSAELIWEGRFHVGDEPGVYGNAEYAGLAVELPVTLTDYSGAGGPADVTFDLTGQGVSNFGPPYPGHKVTVWALTQVASSNPPVWQKQQVSAGVLDADAVSIGVRIEPGIRFVTVRVEADVTVTPGLYDDFVLTGLSLRSTTHYADFGFRA